MYELASALSDTKESFVFSLHSVVLTFQLSVLCPVWERHGPVREDSENDKRSTRHDQKGLNELHLFLR